MVILLRQSLADGPLSKRTSNNKYSQTTTKGQCFKDRSDPKSGPASKLSYNTEKQTITHYGPLFYFSHKMFPEVLNFKK